MAYVGTASNTGNDIYTLASIIQGEAGNQGAQGMQAVGNVIANRAASNWGNNGSTLISQATAPNQFQGQAKPSALALQTAANLVNGNLPDITGGATSYANPGASSAKWAKGLNSQNSLKIGDHYFTDNQNGQPFVPTAQQDQSFYNNAKAAVAANIPPQQLTNLVQAYQSGAMPADARAQFEQDVHSGKITLPAGVYIGGQMAQPGQPQPVQLPASVATAYNMGATNPYQQGAMPDNARAQLDEDLAAGKVALPSGTVLNPHRMTMLENAEEAVTGNLRSTPETQAAKPYYQMPEENQGGIQGIKTALGSMLATNPNEIAQIIKANNPNLESKQDSKGNWLFKSNQDGQWYAIQPGFDLADAAKLGLAAAAFTPAGRASTIVGAAAANAGTQAALEGAKYAAGGNAPDPASIALAGGIGGAVPAAAKILPAVAGAAKKAVGFGVNAAKPEAEAAAEGAASAAPEASGAAAPTPATATPAQAEAAVNADAAQGDKYLDAKEQIAALDKKGNLTSAETSQRNMLAQYVKDIDDGLSPAQAEAAEAGRTSEALKPAPAAKSAPPAGEAEAPATSAAAEGEKPPAGNGEAASASEPEAAPNAGTEPPTTLGQAANATTKEQQANVAGLMGQAARNEPGAAERLAAIIQPDETTLQAARDLGTESHLDLGMISGNKSVREVAGGLATVQGSGASAARIAAINGQAQRAHDIMQALEGTGDISAINNQARQGLTDTQQALQQQGDAAYAQLRANIPKQAPAPATNTLNFIGQRAADLGGADALSPEEKTISRLLTPKSAETPMPEPPAPNPDTGKITPQQFKEYMKQRQAWQDAAGKESKPPTYARLDDVRKDIGRAIAKRQGPFKDADRSLLETLYGHLTADQGAVAQAHGMGDVWKDAKAAVAQRKGVEMRMQKLFGKNLDSTMNAQLGSASDALAKGDVSKLTNLIKAMPPEMKQRVTATALYSSMLKNTRDGRINFANFTKFYEGLARNKQVYSAVMANLPEGAAKQLNSVYHIASAITRANEDVVRTGVIQGLTPQFQGADSILSKLYGVGAHVAANAGHSAGLAVLGHVVGLPGAGEVLGVTKAVISALRAESDKPDAIKAVDTLIASPEFRAGLVKHAQGDTKGAASQIAYSKPFLKFARALGNPRELTDKEKFIMQALNEKNNETEPTPENKK